MVILFKIKFRSYLLKLSMFSVLVSSLLLLSGCDETPEAFKQSFLRLLAKRNGFNVLANGGENAVIIGDIYSTEKPLTPGQLYDYAHAGKEVNVYDYDDGVRLKGRFIKKDAVTMGSTTSAEWNAELSVTIKKYGLKAELIDQALKEAEVQYQLWEFTAYQKNLIDFSKKKNYKSTDLAPDMTGLVSPFAVLMITDFKFKQFAAKTQEESLVLDVLKPFATASFGRQASSIQTTEIVGNEANVFAFKAIPVLEISSSERAMIRRQQR